MRVVVWLAGSPHALGVTAGLTHADSLYVQGGMVVVLTISTECGPKLNPPLILWPGSHVPSRLPQTGVPPVLVERKESEILVFNSNTLHRPSAVLRRVPDDLDRDMTGASVALHLPVRPVLPKCSCGNARGVSAFTVNHLDSCEFSVVLKRLLRPISVIRDFFESTACDCGEGNSWIDCPQCTADIRMNPWTDSNHQFIPNARLTSLLLRSSENADSMVTCGYPLYEESVAMSADTDHLDVDFTLRGKQDTDWVDKYIPWESPHAHESEPVRRRILRDVLSADGAGFTTLDIKVLPSQIQSLIVRLRSVAQTVLSREQDVTRGGVQSKCGVPYTRANGAELAPLTLSAPGAKGSSLSRDMSHSLQLLVDNVWPSGLSHMSASDLRPDVTSSSAVSFNNPMSSTGAFSEMTATYVEDSSTLGLTYLNSSTRMHCTPQVLHSQRKLVDVINEFRTELTRFIFSGETDTSTLVPIEDASLLATIPRRVLLTNTHIESLGRLQWFGSNKRGRVVVGQGVVGTGAGRSVSRSANIAKNSGGGGVGVDSMTGSMREQRQLAVIMQRFAELQHQENDVGIADAKRAKRRREGACVAHPTYPAAALAPAQSTGSDGPAVVPIAASVLYEAPSNTVPAKCVPQFLHVSTCNDCSDGPASLIHGTCHITCLTVKDPCCIEREILTALESCLCLGKGALEAKFANKGGQHSTRLNMTTEIVKLKILHACDYAGVGAEGRRYASMDNWIVHKQLHTSPAAAEVYRSTLNFFEHGLVLYTYDDTSASVMFLEATSVAAVRQGIHDQKPPFYVCSAVQEALDHRFWVQYWCFWLLRGKQGRARRTYADAMEKWARFAALHGLPKTAELYRLLQTESLQQSSSVFSRAPM